MKFNVFTQISISRLPFAVLKNNKFKVGVAQVVNVFKKFFNKYCFTTHIGPLNVQVHGCFQRVSIIHTDLAL